MNKYTNLIKFAGRMSVETVVGAADAMQFGATCFAVGFEKRARERAIAFVERELARDDSPLQPTLAR